MSLQSSTPTDSTTAAVHFPTRRQALAAERATQHPKPRRAVHRITSHQGSQRFTHSSPGRARRYASLPPACATAALALFAAAALPAQPASAAPTVTALPVPVTAQQYTVPTGSTADLDRDAYSITKPIPKPAPVPPATASSSVATGTAATAIPRRIVNTVAGDIRWPVAGSIQVSSPFGGRSAPCASCSSNHQGADITPGFGTPIGAIAAGTVRVSARHPEYGQYVIIDHVIDGRRISTLYAHMQFGSSPLLPGQHVDVGQLVGLVGSTGASTGAHLHVQVMLDGVTPIDPIAWLTANAGRTL